jgi:hypothetical protein
MNEKENGWKNSHPRKARLVAPPVLHASNHDMRPSTTGRLICLLQPSTTDDTRSPPRVSFGQDPAAISPGRILHYTATTVFDRQLCPGKLNNPIHHLVETLINFMALDISQGSTALRRNRTLQKPIARTPKGVVHFLVGEAANRYFVSEPRFSVGDDLNDALQIPPSTLGSKAAL